MSGFTCTNIRVAPGQRVTVRGEIPVEPKSFVINLAKKDDEIMMHFNPRFNAHGDVRTIVCNSKSGAQWGKEHRESSFPFQEGTTAEITFCHDKKEFTVTLPDNTQFKFPNSSGHEGIECISADGDFVFKGLSLI